MNAATFASGMMDQTFKLLGMCTGGMTDEQYNFDAGGKTNTPAKSHVHAMTSMEFFVVSLIQKGERQWPAVASANGLPENPMEIWGFGGRIPQAPIHEYTEKVKASIMSYLGSISDDEFDRTIDTQFFGTQTVAWIVQLAAGHAIGHAGDIAAIKGMQGLKGLPF